MPYGVSGVAVGPGPGEHCPMKAVRIRAQGRVPVRLSAEWENYADKPARDLKQAAGRERTL